MAQGSIEVITSAASLAPPIPRPREPEPPAASAPIIPPVVDLRTGVRSPRRRVSGGAIALDAVLALGLSLSAAAIDLVPVGVALAAAAGWVVLLAAVGHYRSALANDRGGRLRVVLGAGLRATVLALAVTPWLPATDQVAMAQLVGSLSLGTTFPLLLPTGRRRPRLVLAGRPRDVREAVLELQAADSHEIVAVCLTRRSKVLLGDLPTYVGLDSSPVAAQHHRADALVVLPGARLASAELRRLHWALAGSGTELCVGTGLLDVTPTRTRVFATGGLTLVRTAPPSLRGPRRWLKAAVEQVTATIGLFLLMPVLVVVGLLVRLDSPGPAIYRQQRVGRDGRLFTMYKFRSMSVAADTQRTQLVGFNEADGVLFKIRQDPRTTRVGRRLRRWSVDEVPQLWNVVRGDMSLVGPRPALPEEVARYDVDSARRLVVKPGLTGLWQVSGRSDLSWAESVRLDVKYVENWSLAVDVAILCRTLRAVLAHRGAY